MTLTIDTIDLIYYIFYTLVVVGFTYIIICELYDLLNLNRG